MQAMTTAIWLERELHALAERRGVSLIALARELGTTEQLLTEIARALIHDATERAEHAFVHKSDLPPPADPPTLGDRLAAWHLQRLKLWDLARADAESDALLDDLIEAS